ncbi:MAG: hypothetical protein COV52_07770 [Gammaproteobacteria bacterium CG11_big_fil_rev_8_21_14_0_20_46_22]|nr:MAG: hypothetical protein COW05_03850 [Gammaproteobacteria bacterium CG12_big_fil_rev_8_21_14_0_65_46_12]PIR10655.1 MAG: hypothetical protein COV52_07770 [Gammaproteobacteria bacterium CG11_big_fil_rev_8_21_14_0_20_46_22]
MNRNKYLEKIKSLVGQFPVVALLGPRQCGKTTLARQYRALQSETTHYFDLEDPEDLQRLSEPKTVLSALEGLIIIDEIQTKPDLFPLLRVLVDRPERKQRYLILGSASRHLIQHSSETLAGRLAYIEVTPFSYDETKEEKSLWLRGGFPLAYLANTDDESLTWRKFYIKTFLEQDIPNLGFKVQPQNIRRFWMMLSHYHGQTLNASELGQSLNLSHPTIKHYVDILTDTFMVRQLQPWLANIKKRQVKTPKIYFRDSGIFHALLNIQSMEELLFHPKLGASWEGFAMEAVIHSLGAESEDCFFWGVHNQAELDLLVNQNTGLLGFEFKFSDAPKLTRSMVSSLEHLGLEKLCVIYPGDNAYLLDEKIEVVPLRQFLSR